MSSYVSALPRQRVMSGLDITSALAMAMLTALAAYIRLVRAIPADFPLNDGGLFYLMSQEIQKAHYALPLYTAYNQAGIPFAYPPFALYLAAGLNSVTGWPLLDIIRLLPSIVGALTVPAVYLFSADLLGSQVQAGIAALTFAVLPQNLLWPIMGGGLTRATAFFFAVLALHQVYLLYVRRQNKYIASAALFSSLAVLSHPQVAWFTAFSIPILLLFFGRYRQALVRTALVGVGVLIITAPWWVTVISLHGLSPFLAASQTGIYTPSSWLYLFYFTFTGEPLMSLLSVTGVIGIFACLARREFLLPVWLGAIFILSPRTGSAYAMLPMAILVAIGLNQVILPGLHGLSRNDNAPAGEGRARLPAWFSGRASKAFLGYFFGYSLLAALSISSSSDSSLHVLPKNERDAMQWISEHTPQDSRFLVLTGYDTGIDNSSEWFPVLANRVSLATAQGYEWLPNQFLKRAVGDNALQRCASSNAQCLERWAKAESAGFTHVYVRKADDSGMSCCSALETSLEASPDYALAYSGPGALVFAYKPAR